MSIALYIIIFLASTRLYINYSFLPQKLEADCPRMEPVNDKRASLVPFQISVSKRGIQKPIPLGLLTFHPMSLGVSYTNARLSVEASFADKMLAMKKNDTKKTNSAQTQLTVLPITNEMMGKLGLTVRKDQTVCFAEKLLVGIWMPKNPALRSFLLKAFSTLYIPCIEIHGNTFVLNQKCFARRQNAFLGAYHYFGKMY